MKKHIPESVQAFLGLLIIVSIAFFLRSGNSEEIEESCFINTEEYKNEIFTLSSQYDIPTEKMINILCSFSALMKERSFDSEPIEYDWK